MTITAELGRDTPGSLRHLTSAHTPGPFLTGSRRLTFPAMRNIVDQLNSLFMAYGYRTDTRREAVVFEDTGALARVRQTIVAGQADSIKEADIFENQANFVVTQDDPPLTQFRRLHEICEDSRSKPELLPFSRFVDRLWKGDVAAQWARQNSEAAEDASLPSGMARSARATPTAYYAAQRLRFADGSTEPALTFASTWLDSGSGILAVLAEAGLGKSELTRVLQWRAAVDYANRSQRQDGSGLPPVVVRVRLRDLGALGLDSITEYLRATVRLERVPNTLVLAHLLSFRRLVLLLDGLDELDVPRQEIIDGLHELNDVSGDGARLLLTSRAGLYRAETPIRTQLPGHSIVTLEPLDGDGAISLLKNYGSQTDDARELYQRLPAEVRGVPLFLVWAHLSGHSGGQGASRAETLLEMIHQFCQRDERRIQVPAPEQMDLLSELAYHGSFVGPVTAEDAIILAGDEDSRFVEGPHALLQYDQSNRLHFRYDFFADLFLARGIRANWRRSQDAGPDSFRSWLFERLGERALPPLTLDCLSQLLEVDDLRVAWATASHIPLRLRRWTRRNLLAIALTRVSDGRTDKHEEPRADRLFGLLGSKDLSDSVLTGLTFEMFDFIGWDLRRVHTSGAFFSFCNFSGAQFDDRLAAAEFESCEGLTDATAEEEVLRRGQRVLQRALRPFHNRALGPYALYPRLNEQTPGLDRRAIALLRRQGFVVREQGERANWYICVTPAAREQFQRFLEDPTDKPASTLRNLLFDLGQE